MNSHQPVTSQDSGTSLSVSQIDSEHQTILELARVLRGGIEAGLPPERCRERLVELIQLTEKHFASEEDLMKASAYSGWQAHREEHKKLLDHLRLVEGEVASGVINPCGALSVFVEVSAVSHMRGPDKDFATFLATPALAKAATTVR